MARKTQDSIMHEYETQKSIHEKFTKKMRGLLEDLLAAKELGSHSITARVKEEESLQRKLSRPGAFYGNLADIPDVAGARITTYFADDVDAVCDVIEQEFEVIDTEDKQRQLDPDRFGYVSRHYVVKLSPDRSKLLDWKAFTNLKIEIQIRSILQHAWAEIEHDLGYKSKDQVPRDIRRRFSRLAGLLELADDEFISIRDSLTEYREAVPEQIASDPELVPLDNDSVLAYVKSSPVVRRIDERIAEIGEATLRSIEEDIDVGGETSQFVMMGIETVRELDDCLKTHEQRILAFATAWISRPFASSASWVNALFYLCYVLLGERRASLEDVVTFFERLNISQPDEDEADAKSVLAIYNALEKGLPPPQRTG